MYDARELTVEWIGAVLRVSRTSIYRALGKTTTPAPAASAAPAPALMAEPMAATTEAAGDAPAELAARALARVRGAPVVVRSRSRRWFMVQANLADSERAMRCLKHRLSDVMFHALQEDLRLRLEAAPRKDTRGRLFNPASLTQPRWPALRINHSPDPPPRTLRGVERGSKSPVDNRGER
jgi:hypothetical protein